MPDREMVLQGLECCIRHMEGERVCDECPYDEDFNCLGCSIVLRQAIALLREDALALLREQVRPPVSNTEDKDKPLRIMRYSCGAVIVYRGRDVCPNCGKAVNWND